MTEVVLRESHEIMTAVKLTTEGKERVEKLTAEGKCLGCERTFDPDEVVRCGQCSACYQAARNAIRRRKTDKKTLIRDGKMLPPGKGGRPAANPFSKQLAEL
jgi:protein-arginine kinase activator protein McsA